MKIHILARHNLRTSHYFSFLSNERFERPPLLQTQVIYTREFPFDSIKHE